MIPVIYDPDRHTKPLLFAEARALADWFTAEHELEPWTLHQRTLRYFGMYRPATRRHGAQILLHVERCRTPARVPGFSWTWPGYKADLSVAGVLLHELGHHVWSCIHRASSAASWRAHEQAWREARRDEERVSSYEPILEETFTEAFKVFSLNPDLLRVGRPHRWSLLLGSGLKPAHDLPWREVLRNGHPKLVAAAERWIEKGKS